ncbi:glycosyltransferase family 2 protein [Desulfonatronovibrio magnus]|uniref:glycosyltransferase family 2 protein n=1 Tax=Desulfonatronovibrio magnus TaxID=698827 RepID=UPI0005EB7295|nr:glycosyltransferase family 2 protein [Desulfonatronovibrio magnus]RQD60705.1 MAG: glycosyltransferase family 2 protein [Desulfonatronovibrio sp. MSAO_Bac4]
MTSLVSVIIPTYNRAWCLNRAIYSVLAQDYRHFELIVVDDGSTDTTAGITDSFHDRRIRYIYQDNKGVAAARNTGLSISRGRYAAFLDSDDTWMPDKLGRHLNFMCESGFKISQTEEIWFRKGKRVNPMIKHHKPSGWIFERSLELCLVSPSCTIMNMDLVDQGFVFNEGLPACEDYDLWLRISLHYPFGLLPVPLTVRNGGRPDQLSSKIIGLDLYRIYSLLDIKKHGVLDYEADLALNSILKNKVRIYCQGCLKRGRVEEAMRVQELVLQYFSNLPPQFCSKKQEAFLL